MIGFQLYRRTAKATRQHFAHLGAAGWTYRDICALLRACTSTQRISELLSSVEMSARETARLERRDAAATARAEALARAHGCRFIFSGDPRGYPLLVSLDSNPATRQTAPAPLPNTGWSGGYALD